MSAQEGSTTATVETMTAAVHVLMVGNRQVTLSVAKQLDFCPDLNLFEPMGRVKLGPAEFLTMIGRHRETGALVLHQATRNYDGPRRTPTPRGSKWIPDREMKALYREAEERFQAMEQMPLIVLAGLR